MNKNELAKCRDRPSEAKPATREQTISINLSRDASAERTKQTKKLFSEMQNITVGRICLSSWHKLMYLFVCVVSSSFFKKKRCGRLEAINCFSTTSRQYLKNMFSL